MVSIKIDPCINTSNFRVFWSLKYKSGGLASLNFYKDENRFFYHRINLEDGQGTFVVPYQYFDTVRISLVAEDNITSVIPEIIKRDLVIYQEWSTFILIFSCLCVAILLLIMFNYQDMSRIVNLFKGQKSSHSLLSVDHLAPV